MYVHQLIDPAVLAEAVEARLVRSQRHPTLPLTIYNYTEAAVYGRLWNEATLTCRGLIVGDDGAVVARPWPKFFNHNEPAAGELDLDALAEVTDKMDGSLGILYPVPGGWAIATRGSFTSDQAVHGTELLQAHLAAGFDPIPVWTYLFEIVYPDNRIVLDYGDRDELVLLGAVHIPTGGTSGSSFHAASWLGARAGVFPARTLREALAMTPRPNAEGLVVRFTSTGRMVKIKQADYMALHAILTGMNARRVWEFLAVHACKHQVAKAVHWGSLLKVDPADAERILATGGDWQDALIKNVPDEFHAWLTATVETIRERVATTLSAWRTLADSASHLYSTRAERWAALDGAQHRGEVMGLIDGKDVTARAWLACRPLAERPWGARGEDVA